MNMYVNFPVDAIMNIKSKYGVKKNWQGDPCAPKAYIWDGLNCSYDDHDQSHGSVRITSLQVSAYENIVFVILSLYG